MSDTPETDAAWDKYISPPYTYGAGDLRILAQRLERERDEAIQQRHETNESSKYAVDYAIRERDEAKELAERMFRERAEALKEIHNQFVEYDKLFDEAEKIRGERDEAREELSDIRLNLGADAEGYTLLHAVCSIQNERDEARTVAGDLAEIASKYLSFLLAVTPAKTNETHEKETMKVIDALKRWKKL